MCYDLMTEEIEIHPLRARAPFGATEQVAIKGSGLGKITHWKRKMKTRAF